MAIDRWDEYRFLIEDTQQISTRRQSNDNNYLSATSIVLGAVAFLIAQGGLRNVMMLGVVFAIALAGIIISLQWARQNNNYRALLEFRYNLLHKMETHQDFPFPVPLFHQEDLVYKQRQGRLSHFGFSESSQWLPQVFGMLYTLSIIVVIGVLTFVAFTGQWSAWGIALR
jgi:hypothetical protein